MQFNGARSGTYSTVTGQTEPEPGELGCWLGCWVPECSIPKRKMQLPPTHLLLLTTRYLCTSGDSYP